MTASELRELRRRARTAGVRTPAALAREMVIPTVEPTPAPAPRPLLKKAPFALRRHAWAGVLASDYTPAHLMA